MYKKRMLYLIFLLMLLPALAGAQEKQNEPVLLGIDRLEEYLPLFANKRVGLITNPTGVNRHLESTADVLAGKVQLVALFGPEHGIRGNVAAGDKVEGQKDTVTGLPVYSLYGSTRKPTPEMLSQVDVLCFDIQDVGARFYTYASTMALAMQAAKEQGKRFVVFDRPNPIGGVMVEGPVLRPGLESFVGMYPIPIRHGLTMGELARLFNDRFGIGCDLTVIPMKGWKRSQYWQDTGLPWVMTSPNIPTPDTALVYAGTGLLGATTISEGVGTTRPFELVGAFWVDAQQVAQRMNDYQVPGAYFRPAYFTPRFGDHAGVQQGGVQIYVTDKKQYQAVTTAVLLLETFRTLEPRHFFFKPQETFARNVGERDWQLGAEPVPVMLKRWQKESAQFKEMSKVYWLYQEL